MKTRDDFFRDRMLPACAWIDEHQNEIPVDIFNMIALMMATMVALTASNPREVKKAIEAVMTAADTIMPPGTTVQ